MARSFTGATDTSSLASSATLQPTTGGNNFFTISVAVKKSTTIPTNSYITCFDQGATNYGVYIGAQGGAPNKLAWYAKASAFGVDPGTAVLSDNVWYTLTQTFDSTIARMNTFVNGVSDGTVTAAAGSITWGGGNTRVGQSLASLTVTLADFAIWNVVLSSLEITALANGARPGDIRPSNLGAWLPYDGNYSPEPDLSRNKNNGTLTGTASAFGPPVRMITPRWPQYLDVVTVAPQILMPAIQL